MAVMPDRVAKRDFVPLEPFVHQVGGHCSMMRFDDVSVCKPLKQREHRFYEEQPPEMRPFTPEYRGVVFVSVEEDKDGFIYLTAHPDKLALECQKKEGSTKFCITNSDNDGSSGEDEGESTPEKGLHRVRLQSGKLELVNTRPDGLFEAGDMPGHSSDMVSHGWPDSRNHIVQAVMPAGTTLNGSAGVNPWSLYCHKEQLSRMRELGSSSKTHKFIVLENVAHRFSTPCILDLKMGTRHHGDDAPSDKRERQIAKAEQSTSKTLGIRAGGMQVYNNGSGRFMCRNKYYGLKLCEEGFKEELVTFLHNGEQFRMELIEPLLYKLRKLYKVIEKQSSYRFYSSSLLLMYEGDMQRKCSCNTEKEQDTYRQKENINRSCSSCSLNKNGKFNSHHSCKVDVRMIDFAHTTYGVFAGDPVRNGPDSGYLFGLKNLIRLLEEIRDKYQGSTEVKTQESGIISDKS